MICYYCKKGKGKKRLRFNPICDQCYKKKIKSTKNKSKKILLKSGRCYKKGEGPISC